MKVKRLLIVFLLLPIHLIATTTEQHQRFLYYFYEAQRLWQADQYADAFALLEFCHALSPNDAITNRYMGHIYQGCHLTDQALVYYRTAWEQAPSECWKEYAVTLYNTGTNEAKAEAIAVMEKAGELLPNEADLWSHLRDAYLGNKQFKQALSAQDIIDHIEGYDAYSAIHRYRIYLMMNKPKKAIAAIEQYLVEDPTNLQFQLYRMQLYEATGQPVKSLIEVYQQVLNLDPFNALVLNNYAYLLATHKGDLKLAEKMSAKAVQADPQNYTFLDTYAWVLYLTGQKELAKLYIRQAVNAFKEQTLPKEIQQHFNTINK